MNRINIVPSTPCKQEITIFLRSSRIHTILVSQFLDRIVSLHIHAFVEFIKFIQSYFTLSFIHITFNGRNLLIKFIVNQRMIHFIAFILIDRMYIVNIISPNFARMFSSRQRFHAKAGQNIICTGIVRTAVLTIIDFPSRSPSKFRVVCACSGIISATNIGVKSSTAFKQQPALQIPRTFPFICQFNLTLS